MTNVRTHILGLLLLSFSHMPQAIAEEIKTTYSISGSSATVSTMIKSASAEKENLMKDFLFEKIADKIRTMPMVTGIEFNKDIKGTVSTSSYSDYWELKRSYPVIVHLALPTSVTMMVKVEESYRTCKSPAEKAASLSTATSSYDDYRGGRYGGGDSARVDCTLESDVSIKGPYATYGNFASALEIDKLMKEKQSITFEVGRDYSDKTQLKVQSRFSIESEQFDTSLLKFLSAFNLQVADSEGRSFTRNNILLGIARILRVNNEKVVE